MMRLSVTTLSFALLLLVEQIDTWDVIILGYNLDVPVEFEIAPGILCGGGFSVRYPTPEQLADYASSTNVVALHRLNFSLGVCGYSISPRGAQTLLQMCFPMDNRPVFCASVT
jgi:glycosyl transferase, family 25